MKKINKYEKKFKNIKKFHKIVKKLSLITFFCIIGLYYAKKKWKKNEKKQKKITQTQKKNEKGNGNEEIQVKSVFHLSQKKT